MPKLSNMLKKESEEIKKNKDVGKRTDCSELLISAKFGEDHIHHILPEQNSVDKIVDDLLSYTSEEYNKSLIQNKEENKPPKEVIFHNRQAIGDILCLTCGIRDFKNQFPDTRVGVIATAMHIFDNNPYIDHSFRPGTLENDKKIVKIGPGFLTNKSWLWDYHFANGFRLDIQNKLNVKITQGPIRPDIWLTQEEYDRDPIIEGPYWIICPPGAVGWPSKQYHRWQEVVNMLKDDITFVQLGTKSHPYPILDNIINFVGKTEDRNTGIRDLFNIFLHAQGSMGLVSMHMHLSAAFNNPSVVVAGGREPASFTQYYGHQYIQNNGCLPCVQDKACWACKLEGCKNLVDPTNTPTKGHISKQIPKCVDIIEPEQIAEGVRQYYKGGRLEYGKKIPNTFFKNIVREKKVFSVPEPKKVDNELLKKYGFEWGGGSITDRDWLFLCDIFDTYNIKKVLEFGAGLSTLLMASKVDKVVTFETQQGWINKISKMSDKEKNYFFLWDGKKIDLNSSDFKDVKFDFAFVDGPAGGANREFSTMYASKLADIIVVHDAGREWERKWQEKYLSKDFELVARGGHRCHLWTKKEIAKKKKEEEQKIIEMKIADDYRPIAKVVTTARGYGGSERSTIKIMDMLQKNGYRVDFVSTGNISGEFNKNIPEGVLIRDWKDITEKCDILVFYASDTIWNYNKPQYIDIMDKLNAKRKVFILNYKIGGAGNISWTKGWDKYLFLNSTNEKELLKRIPDAKTKVLPPPTELEEFFKVNVNYNNGIRLGRHSSQRDAKHHQITNDFINQVWNEIGEDIEFYYMPAWSKTFEDERIHKFKVNEVTIQEFLSKINVFFYMLPDGYTDAGPRVILECMSCGIPVIADNHSGPADRITKETGWLCNDVNDYLDAIKEIYNNPRIIKEKGLAARKYAKENFIPERWVDEIIE